MAVSVAQHGTLVASTVTTVTVNAAHEAVTVTVRGASPADIFFTVGTSGNTPTAPTSGGNDCYVVPGVNGASKTVLAGSAPVVVSLISTGTPAYSVEGGLATPVREL
jgi:hypothetical protein